MLTEITFAFTKFSFTRSRSTALRQAHLKENDKHKSPETRTSGLNTCANQEKRAAES